MRQLLIFVGLFGLIGCAAQPINLTADSPVGVVALKVKPPPSLRPGAGVVAIVVAVDPQTGKFRGGFEGFGVTKAPNRPAFELLKLKPGEYVFHSVSTNFGVPAWGACFNGGTYRFRVEPGTVLYLGEMDVEGDLQEIAAKLPRSLLRNQLSYVFDTPRPQLTPPSPDGAWPSELKAFLGAAQPGVSAPVRAAVLQPGSFGTGRDLFGLQRVCGGWYQGSKPQT